MVPFRPSNCGEDRSPEPLGQVSRDFHRIHRRETELSQRAADIDLGNA